MVFVCHVTLQDYAIKPLYDFMIRNLSRYITILASLVAGVCGSGDKIV